METRGIPLDLILSSLYSDNYVVDWFDFVKTGLSTGWKISTIIEKIEAAFYDCELPEIGNNVIVKIRSLVDHITTDFKDSI